MQPELKNAINVLMKNYMDMCLGGLIFWGFGYGVMFGMNHTGWFGTSQFAPESFTMAEAIKLAYQMMFAGAAATIVSGAVAERMHFPAYMIFSGIVTGVIYPIYGSWVWNEHGWLAGLGFIDFAGSTVVHSIGAWCGLAGVIVLGPRLGRYSRSGESRDIPGHNLPYVALGGFILWIGWFGFNGGSISSFEKDNVGLVLLNTHLGGCAGGVSALCYMYWRKEPVLMSATVNGSLAGLVSVTASAAYITPSSAIMIGFIGAIFYLLTVRLLDKYQLDDVVGAFAVHGAAGIWGTLAVAVFIKSGFSWHGLAVQALGVIMAFVWAFPLAFIFFKLLDKTIGIKASTLHQQRGLDYTEHFEIGYPEFQKRLDSES
ncbi:ammonium transporter [Methylocucumis oryzae]|uniref:ammonium transporter n=1 Tax=Methylocucumis oryzae TaxID=1632867 RepID=UPI0019554834|nr:ammonium transporter [Methylocucumis oryzae]